MNEKIKEIGKSKWFHRILIGIGVFIAALLVFQLGQFVGFRRANFSYRHGEMFYRGFSNRGERPMDSFFGRDFLMGNGIVGRVLQVSTSSLVVMEQNGVERVVLVTPETLLRSFREAFLLSDLKEGDMLTIIGTSGTDGEVTAKLIRILPPAPSSLMRQFRRG